MINSKILEVIKRRRSIRRYFDAEIEQEKLDLILESARLAPSASNSQKWFFYVVKDLNLRYKIAMSMPLGANPFVKEAPVVIVGCGKKPDLLHKVAGSILKKDWIEMDVTIALEHMALSAAEQGIGSCWIGIYDEKKVKEIVGIPKDQKIIALLTLGYPEDESTPEALGGIPQRPRLDLNDIIKVC